MALTLPRVTQYLQAPEASLACSTHPRLLWTPRGATPDMRCVEIWINAAFLWKPGFCSQDLAWHQGEASCEAQMPTLASGPLGI